MDNCPSLAATRKRSHDGSPVPFTATLNDPKLQQHSESHVLITSNDSAPSISPPGRSRQQSPATSSTASSLTELSNLEGTGDYTLPAATKKRKLTFAEKQAENAATTQEKGDKERLKAEEKLRRDDEKRQRDEEKRKREEEKEAARRVREVERAEKQKVKDAEKQAKEEEKRKREEEQKKKERSQLRMDKFFAKPKASTTPQAALVEDLSAELSSCCPSLASISDLVIQDAPSPEVKDGTEFEKYFLPYSLPGDTILAPANRFPRAKEPMKLVEDVLDASLEEQTSSAAETGSTYIALATTLKCGPHRRRKGFRVAKPVKEIVQEVYNRRVDLTGGNSSTQPEKALSRVRLKVFSFREDVRPPYQGTYTRPVPACTASVLAKAPFRRLLPDTDYDYDSEAEWEPPGEGDDDVDAIDDESESEDDDEDMEDFLDDEDDMIRRRLVVGDMQPVCSGLCWENGGASSKLQSHFTMNDYQMDVIPEYCRFPIDPYSTTNWQTAANNTASTSQKQSSSAHLMQPPRIPLNALSQTSLINNQKPSLTSNGNLAQPDCSTGTSAPPVPQSSRSQGPPKTLKLVADDMLSAFKQEVVGSDLTKAGLVEVLKKKFPKVSKDVIRDTLSAVAVRTGAKEADKRWVLLTTP